MKRKKRERYDVVALPAPEENAGFARRIWPAIYILNSFHVVKTPP